MGSMLLLAGAGVLAGVMNAVAGGGSFVTLAALVAAGVPAVTANASSTVALFPGSLAASWTLRRGVAAFQGISVWAMALVSLVGGLAGAGLLLVTPDVTLNRILPWLLLFGTLALIFGRQAGAVLRRVVTVGRAGLLGCQFVLGVYGGYFGGAVGITMLAVWSLFGGGDLRSLNANRVVLVTASNAMAVVCFVVAGRVAWGPAAVLGGAAVAGSTMGALIARAARPESLRIAIVVLCGALTLAFFWRAYG